MLTHDPSHIFSRVFVGRREEQVKAKVEGDRISFKCPACRDIHTISVAPRRWTWNSDAEHPTFNPSVLVTSGHFTQGHGNEYCWCTHNAEQIAKGEDPSGFECVRCHSFVRNGMIEFLSDSSHSMAGKTVEIPEYEMV